MDRLGTTWSFALGDWRCAAESGGLERHGGGGWFGILTELLLWSSPGS